MGNNSYYQQGSERSKQVRNLFTKISSHYDLVNDLQSFGMHRQWKQSMVSELHLQPGDRILDLACGSGDIGFRAVELQSQCQAVGGDYTFSMLQVAQNRKNQMNEKKVEGLQGWVQLDGLRTPFREKTFDAVTMAYGLRNMPNYLEALKETYRVLKKSGKIAILDFAKPSNLLVQSAYYLSLKTIQPAIGWFFFRDAKTYRYIHESLMQYPKPDGITELLKKSGFENILCHSLSMGCMSLHIAIK